MLSAMRERETDDVICVRLQDKTN